MKELIITAHRSVGCIYGGCGDLKIEYRYPHLLITSDYKGSPLDRVNLINIYDVKMMTTERGSITLSFSDTHYYDGFMISDTEAARRISAFLEECFKDKNGRAG